MIVGLEFDEVLDLVECRTFRDQAPGALWTHRDDRKAEHVRSLYSVTGMSRPSRPVSIARRALNKGRLLADTEYPP